MWIGIVAFIIIFFFGRLMYRRVHARRCDQFLAPLAKVQIKLLEHHTNSKVKKNNKNVENNNNNTNSTNKEEGKATEDGIPLITIQELYGGLTAVHDVKIEDGTSTSGMIPLPSLTKILPASPSVALSVGGQRVIWSRSPNLLRRVLLTHFRMFPGPPTKFVSASSSAAENSAVAELSSYKASAINTAVFLAAFLEQMNLNASSSSSSSNRFQNTNGKVCSRLFDLEDGEKFWDHVTWLGGFKPGQFPDIPGLILRGMSTKREVQYRTIRGNATIHATSSLFQQTPKNKRGEDRVFSVKDSSSVSASKLSKDSSSTKYITNLLVSEMLKDVVGGDEFVKILLDAADSNVFASNNNDDASLTSQISQNMLLPINETKGFISSSSQNFVLCGGFASGMNATSFPLSSLLSTKESKSSPLTSTFSSLVAGLNKVLEKHIDILSEAQEISSKKSVEVGESSTCGLTVALANCGSVRIHNRPGETSVMRNADRWDNLLRKTLSHKSAVVVSHLITYAFDIFNIVLREVLAIDSSSSTEFRKVKGQFTDESFVLEAYVREAMRLNPLVRQAVRAVEGDDPQRAEVFGIAGDLVKVLNTPDEIIALQKSSSSSSSKPESTTGSRKAESDNQQRKMEEIIQSKLDPSLRYSLNGMIATPSSACVVCDVYSMQRNPEIFSVGSAGESCDRFYPQRWAAGSAANQDVQQRGRMEANFAPLGFGAASEASCRYLISLVCEMIDETVSL